jgi:zinc protease
MGLVVAERHDLAVVTAALVTREGTADFPSESPESIWTMLGTMTTDSTTANAHTPSDRMESIAAQLTWFASPQWVGLSLRAMTPSFDPALEILRDQLLASTFEPSRITVVQRHLSAYEEPVSGYATLVAEHVLCARIYGPSHPYVVGEGGPWMTFEGVTRDEVLRAWHDVFDPAGVALVVAGDVDAAKLKERVIALFGGWARSPSRPVRAPVAAGVPASAPVAFVERRGAPIVVVEIGVNLDATGSTPTAVVGVVSSLLGGVRSDAFSDTLRRTFGATTLTARGVLHRDRTMLRVTASLPPDTAARAISAVEARLEELRERGPAPEDLADAKRRVAHNRAFSLETAGTWLDATLEKVAFGRPLGDLATDQAEVDAVSIDDVRAAIPPNDRVRVVVVGDRSKVRASLVSRFGATNVEDVDRTGKPVAER